MQSDRCSKCNGTMQQVPNSNFVWCPPCKDAEMREADLVHLLKTIVQKEEQAEKERQQKQENSFRHWNPTINAYLMTLKNKN